MQHAHGAHGIRAGSAARSRLAGRAGNYHEPGDGWMAVTARYNPVAGDPRSDHYFEEFRKGCVGMERARGFLSWSTADARIGPVADIFKAWISSLFYGGIEFFLSREIQPGENAIPTVYAALNEADFGFVFLSQRTARSPWVIYESGCLNPSLRADRVFPLLFDLSPRELRDICPPLADFQAVSLMERDGMRRLVDKIASIVELDDGESIAVKDRFHDQYPMLERAIQAVNGDSPDTSGPV
jgi:hypothetical protein